MARDEGGSGFLWFLAGLGIGAIVGVLYAPQSGAETRETIRRSAEEGRDWAASTARRAREQAGEWVDRGKDAINTQRDTWNQAIQAGKQAYREATSGTETTRTAGSTGQQS